LNFVLDLFHSVDRIVTQQPASVESPMAALGYVTIGAIDSKKSGAFYDAVFTALGSERKLENAPRSVSARQRLKQARGGRGYPGRLS
jgi:hypothetical protein